VDLVDRRRFLGAAGAGFALSLLPRGAEALAKSEAVFATAYQRRDGGYGVAVLSERRELIHSIGLPDRGHDVTFEPVSGRSVVFARQPGTFMTVFDHARRSAPVTIASAEGRHFYGHGVFSPDGTLLYATENAFDAAAGVVGIYDARGGFGRVGEFATHGVGPHEMVLLGDGRTLAIANGGIETHPDFGRAKLNIATMRPSFVLVDRLTGELVEKHELPPALHQLSIRHMDIDADGRIWFGCQHEGPASEKPPLVGVARRGEELLMLDIPEKALLGLRNYVGSVATNRDAGTVAVSSPQGNCLAVIDVRAMRLREVRRLVEVCGLAPEGADFLASTGTGELVDPDHEATSFAGYAWDNHILRIDL
jgi:hypothetical protein